MRHADVPYVLADNGLDAVENRSTFGRQQNHPPMDSEVRQRLGESESRPPASPIAEGLAVQPPAMLIGASVGGPSIVVHRRQ